MNHESTSILVERVERLRQEGFTCTCGSRMACEHSTKGVRVVCSCSRTVDSYLAGLLHEPPGDWHPNRDEAVACWMLEHILTQP